MMRWVSCINVEKINFTKKYKDNQTIVQHSYLKEQQTNSLHFKLNIKIFYIFVCLMISHAYFSFEIQIIHFEIIYFV